ELDDYFAMLEEAKKRDHRKLGKELELYVFDDDVGPGLPMFLPRGAVIAEELEKLAKETEFDAGYQRVRSPAIARESLYKKSGHLPYYAESMFPPMTLRAEGGTKVDVEAEARSIERADQLLRESLEKIFPRLKDSDYLLEEFEKDFWQQPKQSQILLEKSAIASIFSKSKRGQRPEPDPYYLKPINCR